MIVHGVIQVVTKRRELQLELSTELYACYDHVDIVGGECNMASVASQGSDIPGIPSESGV